MDLSKAILADFAAHVGSEFRVATESGGATALELAEAAPLPYSGNPARPEPFSLIFRGPSDRPLAQRIHCLDHNRLGRLNVFLVPIVPGADGAGPYYQAIFN